MGETADWAEARVQIQAIEGLLSESGVVVYGQLRNPFAIYLLRGETI